MGTYSPENLRMRNNQQYNSGFNGFNNFNNYNNHSNYNNYSNPGTQQLFGGYSTAPRYVSSNKMVGPKGYVPVYDTTECLHTKKEESSWENYNAYKDMAKMDNDPYIIAVARMEADAQFKNLKGYSDVGHEYYKNNAIKQLEPRKK